MKRKKSTMSGQITCSRYADSTPEKMHCIGRMYRSQNDRKEVTRILTSLRHFVRQIASYRRGEMVAKMCIHSGSPAQTILRVWGHSTVYRVWRMPQRLVVMSQSTYSRTRCEKRSQ